MDNILCLSLLSLVCIYPFYPSCIYQDRAADEKSHLVKVGVDEILDAQRNEQIAKDQHEKAIVKARLQLGMHVNLPDSYVGSKDDFGT